jgi:20S proteasome alpha/beta subunit
MCGDALGADLGPQKLRFKIKKLEMEAFMSQLAVCRNMNGIVLAADSKALDFVSPEKITEVGVTRLLQLDKQTAVLTGGAVEGSRMCKKLKSFLEGEKLIDIEEIYGATLPFLASEYEMFMRKECQVAPIDPIHYVHFILAGYSPKKAEDPFHLYLLWTKKKLPQLDGDEIGLAYTVPRRMGLEYRLNQLCKDNAPLEQILSVVKDSMERLGQTEEKVGPPYDYAIITKQGFKKVE